MTAAGPGAASAEWWRPQVVAAGASTPTEGGSPAVGSDTSELAFRALIAFTCVLLLAPQNFLPALGSIRIALLTGTLAIVAHVTNRWSRGQPLAKPGREMGLAAGLLIWTAVTLPFSQWPGGSIALFLSLYLKSLAVFWLIGTLVDTLPRLRGMAWTLTLATLALALVGISNYFSGAFGPARDQRILGYDAGLTRNPNDLAMMLNLIIPVAVALLLTSRGPLLRGVLMAILALQATAVILTFSRAGFLTLATTSSLYGMRLILRPSRGLVLVALAVAAMGLPFVPTSYVDRLLTLRAIEADPTGSAQARWTGTVAALEHVGANPILGAGLGMNILVLNESVGATWRVVHNTYLEYAVDLGVPGVLLFGLLLLRCWQSARLARRLGSSETAQLAEGVEISLMGFAVAAVFQPVAYQFYFFYIAGLAVATRIVAAAEAAAPHAQATA
jgi:hypothetical protein